MLAFTPLLIEDQPEVLYTGRAIIDFIMLAKYRSYDDDTLRYISAALKRIDLLKEVFRRYRPKDTITSKGHFNYPKFHSLLYLLEKIRALGPIDGYST